MQQKILVVGVTAGGAASLPDTVRERVISADLLVGGQRQLDYFPNFAGEKLSMSCGIGAAAERLRTALASGTQAVVVASGDPLCYGIGSSLLRYFVRDELEVVPAPTAFQLAFAALVEPWHDAALLSAHNRPLEAVVRGVLHTPKAAIMTDNHQTPPVIAEALLIAGLSPDTPCAVCENLGSANQRVIRLTLTEVQHHAAAPLNVLVVWQTGNTETHC